MSLRVAEVLVENFFGEPDSCDILLHSQEKQLTPLYNLI